MFCSVQLASRIERAECGLLSDAAGAVRRKRDADVLIMPIASGVATYTGEDSPLNKVAGLGFDGPVHAEQLQAVEAAFAARAAPVQVELSCLADPQVAAMLTQRGYVLQGFENVLGLPLAQHESQEDPPGDIQISVCAASDFAAWLDTFVTAFASPDTQGVPSHEAFPRDALCRVITDMAGASGMSQYLALRQGAPAGGASMRIANGVAQLCGAATLPNHRRRGVQSALLRARLRDAAQAGCDIATLTTLPGSKSQENAHRHGFTLLYTRAILVCAAAPYTTAAPHSEHTFDPDRG